MASAWWARFERVMTREYFPEWERWLRWLRHPLTTLAAAALAAFLLGVRVGPQGYAACGALVVFMALGVLWPHVAVRGLTASVRFTRRRTVEGSPVGLELIVRNRWPIPLWGIALEWKSEPNGDEARTEGTRREAAPVLLSLARVPAWTRQVCEGQFVPAQRGEYPADGLLLATSFPFGLSRAKIRVEVAESLLVWPRAVPLRAARGGHRASWQLEDARSESAGDDGETIGLREYRPGDGLKLVHWPYTARQGRIIVRQRQRYGAAALRLTIDTCLAHHGRCAGVSSLDWSVRIAASLIRDAVQRGDAVELTINDQPVVVAAGRDALTLLLDRLARCHLVAQTRALLSSDSTFTSKSLDRNSSDRWLITTDRADDSAAQQERATGRPQSRSIVLVLDGVASTAEKSDSREWSRSGEATLRIESTPDPLTQFQQVWEEPAYVIRRHA